MLSTSALSRTLIQTSCHIHCRKQQNAASRTQALRPPFSRSPPCFRIRLTCYDGRSSFPRSRNPPRIPRRRRAANSSDSDRPIITSWSEKCGSCFNFRRFGKRISAGETALLDVDLNPEMVSVNLGVLHYILDHIYGSFVHRTRLGTPFFSKGWGGSRLDLLERMVKQLFPEAAGQNWPPNMVQPIWKTVWETKNACLREGVFRTPCNEQLIDALPPESYDARVAFLTPKLVPPQKMACVVHLAGTGDHTFERRLRLGGPLLKENIATMVLESPFYGRRRPRLQRGAKLLCVSDLLLLGRVTIEEARNLLHWLEVEAGFGKTGICGLSMGGVHAAMVGSLHPTPVATLPFLSPHSAVVAFCDGVLKHATAWEALRDDAAQKSGMTLEQAEERLRSVLALTDVTRFPLPKNPQAVIFVAATDDGYIPKHSVMELQSAWPGSEVRWVTGGHVSSFLLHNDAFRKAIVDALDRLPWREPTL